MGIPISELIQIVRSQPQCVDTDVMRVIAVVNPVNELWPLLVFIPQIREKKRKVGIKKATPERSPD